MIRHLMAFSDHPADNVRIHLGIFTDDKKGTFDVTRLQDVQQLGREGRVRAIVKGHGHHRLGDVYLRIANLGPSRRHGRHGGGIIHPPSERIVLQNRFLRQHGLLRIRQCGGRGLLIGGG